MSMPTFILDEIRMAFWDEGPYKNRGWGSKAGYFFQRSMPITRVHGTFMAMAGLGQNDLAMDASVSAYWSWRFDEKPPGRTTAQDVDKDRKRFRRAMGSAYRAFRNGDDISGFLTEALQIPTMEPKNVRAALRRRRLLTTLEDLEKVALRERIGQDAFDKLVLHDAILDGWAESFKTPKRLK